MIPLIFNCHNCNCHTGWCAYALLLFDTGKITPLGVFLYEACERPAEFVANSWYFPMRLVRAKRISLPLDELLQFLIVVLDKFATDGLYKIGQLALVTPRIGPQVGHHAAWFLPTEVGVLKFCAADMRAKKKKKHRN